MKRELDSALIGGAELAGELCSTRVSPNLTQASFCGEVDDRTSCKRIKATHVNGFVVYTRTKKSRLSGDGNYAENAETKRMKSLDEPKKEVLQSTVLKTEVTELRIVKNTTDRSSVVKTVYDELKFDEIKVVESVANINARAKNGAEERFCDAETLIDENVLVEVAIKESPIIEKVLDEIPVEVLLEESLIFALERNRYEDRPSCSSGAEFISKKGTFTGRFTRSALKGETDRNWEPQDAESEANENLCWKAAAECSPSTTSWNNLVSKMSENFVLNKRPMTVKELFDTGLLDGAPVVYMGSIKSQAFGLRGTIKDGGILCSCSLCNSSRVIPPSKFEIHACKQYRRAAQYICFENGKSLLEVLKSCRNTPLHALKKTICDIIGALPQEKSFTCKRCKGSYPISSLGQAGPLCKSCLASAKSESSAVCAIGIRTSERASVCSYSSNKSQLETKNSLIPFGSSEQMPNLANCTSAYLSSQIKGAPKMSRKSSKPASMPKSYRSATGCIPPRNKKRWKLKKMSTKSVLASRASQSASHVIAQKKIQWKITKKDQRLHKLVFEKGGLPDGTELAYYARGQKLLEGYKSGSGIFCYCCKWEISPSQFEAHAGWSSRRKPYAYIYTSNGVSLHEWAISLSRGRKYSVKDNDDLCVICADGGNLLLCDGCPRAFHKECISLSNVPRGKWYCKYCEKRFEREKLMECSENAVAAGRLIGVDPIEQITTRCIRVVKSLEAEISGCVLCRASDFSKSGFGPRTIIICDQCEKEYHIGCLRNHKMADLKELPKGKWFCCVDCTRIHSTLQKLLVDGAEKLSDSLLEVIWKKHGEKDSDAPPAIDVRWRLLSGKVASPESRKLLSQSLAIFHDCFDPIVDPLSGRNLIPRMVYGKNMKGQDYGGMCCAVLTVNSFVVSAGLLRVFGREVAELPLVATSVGKHGKGYFQLLFSCIEKLLSFLNIENIVVPAAQEAESIWVNKFGFSRIEPEQLSRYSKSCYQMVKFKGASMLQKQLPPCRIIETKTESL